MKVLFQFIVVIFMLFLGDTVYCQPLENFDGAGKDSEMNQIEKSPLEAEQNLSPQMDLLNSMIYDKTIKGLTAEKPITFTEDFNGYKASESTMPDDPKHYFDKNRNVHIPSSRYYERPDTDRFDDTTDLENFEPWCTGFSSVLGRIRLK